MGANGAPAIAQADILLFSKSAKYKAPKWPDDYWPSLPAPKNKSQWAKSVKAFQSDLAAFEKLVLNPKKDLYEPFPSGAIDKHCFSEALLLADHNAWHLAQLMLVRRMIEA